MLLKRFTVKVIARIVLIMANVIVLANIFGNEDLFFNQLILGAVLIIQVIELIHFVNQTNRELAKLFYAIRHADFSLTYKESQLGNSFRELNDGLTTIVDAYKKVKIEKEAQYHFLQTLVNQINVGIIALEDQRITLVNARTQALLGIGNVKNWALIKQTLPALAEAIDTIPEGRQLIELPVGESTRFMAIEVTQLTIMEKHTKLITLHDINSEIEQKEIEAWHKLIRILTHEIMNSVTPITSLTETMQQLLTDRSGAQKLSHQISEETVSDIRFSLTTIQKRSEGLLDFVESYRKLSRVPKPRLEQIGVKPYLEHIRTLLSAELDQEGVHLSLEVYPEDMELKLDHVLMEQVFINLITNAIHAVENRPEKQITIKAYNTESNPVFEVNDTGSGIPEKELKEIFIPFFSTKKNGSGIGLSLVKQIVSLHGGSVQVQSTPERGTNFTIRFRKSTISSGGTSF